MNRAEGAARDHEILAETGDRAAVDEADTGDHPIGGQRLRFHAETACLMLSVKAELLERMLGIESFESLTRGELALRVTLGDSLGPARGEGRGLSSLKIVE